MRIDELVPRNGRNLIIHNPDTQHTMVLTPEGAVFTNEDTRDLRNISVAFGLLFTSHAWRPATIREIRAFRIRKSDHMLKFDENQELNWQEPAKAEPHLKLVKKDE